MVGGEGLSNQAEEIEIQRQGRAQPAEVNVWGVERRRGREGGREGRGGAVDEEGKEVKGVSGSGAPSKLLSLDVGFGAKLGTGRRGLGDLGLCPKRVSEKACGARGQ